MCALKNYDVTLVNSEESYEHIGVFDNYSKTIGSRNFKTKL